ncbi:MAG: carbohydrate kinase [Anaerolineae bacterium]|nr:carbohydrate kinase [Anaerolineae bacterium]
MTFLPLPDGDIDLLTIGEIVVDLISKEEITALEAARAFHKYQGGSPANLARYVAQLGGAAALIAKTGADTFGSFLEAELREAGVFTNALGNVPGAHTTCIFISRTAGTADAIAYRDADFQLHPEDVDETLIRKAKIVHTSTFALAREPSRTTIEETLRLAHQYRKIVSFDPNYNPPDWLNREEAMETLRRVFRYVDVTKPSLDDAERLFGAGLHPTDYIGRYHEMGAAVVVFTMGRRGALLSYRNQVAAFPAPTVEVADATGAGDAFWAGFLTALVDGASLELATRFALEIAAIKIQTVGPLRLRLDRAALYRQLTPA